VAETSWPTIAGSRVVTDDQFELMSAHWSADGVYAATGSLAPCFGDSSGMQVKIRANTRAIVGGHGYHSGSPDITKSIGANGSGSTRLDAVVLGLDRTTWAVTSYVKAGTAGSGVPPSLQRDARGGGSGKWEVPLAVVTVTNGAATITSGNVSNVAWYAHGDTVSTLSTAATAMQPPATDYARLRYSDTGVEYDSVNGAWRRGPWSTAWGIIGGRRYTSNTTVAGPIGLSEAVANIQSGTINLVADRRYRIHAHCRVAGDSTGISITVRARETNISGTTVGLWQATMVDFGWSSDYHFVNEFISPGTTTRTYILTLKTEGGLVNSNTGTANSPTGIWIEDVGPAVPSLVTVTA
jgi:hypothetical protein